jgi:hypothetical protein
MGIDPRGQNAEILKGTKDAVTLVLEGTKEELGQLAKLVGSLKESTAVNLINKGVESGTKGSMTSSVAGTATSAGTSTAPTSNGGGLMAYVPVNTLIALLQGSDNVDSAVGKDLFNIGFTKVAAGKIGTPEIMITEIVVSELVDDINAAKGYEPWSQEQYESVFLNNGGIITRAAGWYGEGCQWVGEQIAKGIYNLFK